MSGLHSVNLSTARLRLRPFALEDAPRVEMLAGHAEVARYTCNIPHPYPAGAAAKWIADHAAAFSEDRSITWAIERNEDATLLGAIHLMPSLEHSRGEIGYWIGQPYWGLGYCSEAARSLLDYAFSVRSLHKVCSHHFGPNLASGRIMQKIGMSHDGTLRQHIFKNGNFHDLVSYSILRHEWENSRISPV